jgi:signal peptidase I
MKAFLRELAITLGLALVIFLIFQTVVQNFIIKEQCMEPGFHEGERLLVNKVAYHFGEPRRGDVIILRPPSSPKEVFIKRIIALPGDTVEVKEGAVYVNGTKLNEPYLKEPMDYTLPERKIPENEYFVLGDNRNIANDSHRGWTLPRKDIIGRAWLILWPLKDWGFVKHYPLQEQLASASTSGG